LTNPREALRDNNLRGPIPEHTRKVRKISTLRVFTESPILELLSQSPPFPYPNSNSNKRLQDSAVTFNSTRSGFMVKYWSNVGQKLVKSWSEVGQKLVKTADFRVKMGLFWNKTG
jgi:hypothetical protein